MKKERKEEAWPLLPTVTLASKLQDYSEARWKREIQACTAKTLKLKNTQNTRGESDFTANFKMR